MDVRLVPISAEQISAIESLERALRGLADDFQRDIGTGEIESMAGGLYRLWSTLEAIRTMWHAEGRIQRRARADSEPLHCRIEEEGFDRPASSRMPGKSTRRARAPDR